MMQAGRRLPPRSQRWDHAAAAPPATQHGAGSHRQQQLLPSGGWPRGPFPPSGPAPVHFWHRTGSALRARLRLGFAEEGGEQHGGGQECQSWMQTSHLSPSQLLPAGEEIPVATSSQHTKQTSAAQQGPATSDGSVASSLPVPLPSPGVSAGFTGCLRIKDLALRLQTISHI